ncbi:MAG: sulfurtransferase [Pseudomonadota bacterium]
MPPTYTTLITADELRRLGDTCVLLDCRSDLADHGWGRRAYQDGHIPGARFADLETDLADPPGKDGRHPLPDRDRWLQTVIAWGVDADTQVVVYDHAGGAFAARAWWMFKWLGHAAVAVLDGGIQQWGGPLVADGETRPLSGNLSTRAALVSLLDSVQMSVWSSQPEAAQRIVDARTEARWAGREEPIDSVAGHIPGAVCLPFQDNLNAEGRFKTAPELAARFASLRDKDVVCYCGSGVTAAHNVLAMAVAGLPMPALYAPSWSGWITDPDRPIATADPSPSP